MNEILHIQVVELIVILRFLNHDSRFDHRKSLKKLKEKFNIVGIQKHLLELIIQ